MRGGGTKNRQLMFSKDKMFSFKFSYKFLLQKSSNVLCRATPSSPLLCRRMELISLLFAVS